MPSVNPFHARPTKNGGFVVEVADLTPGSILIHGFQTLAFLDAGSLADWVRGTYGPGPDAAPAGPDSEDSKGGASMICLGDRVRCRVTGFEGIATARTQYLTESDRYCVEPTGVDPNGKPIECQWFAVRRLEVIGRQAVARG